MTVPAYSCPIDRPGSVYQDSAVVLAKGNYSLNYGNSSTDWTKSDYRGVMAADSWCHNQAPTFITNLLMTIDTPNSSVADNNLCNPTTDTDPKMPCTGGTVVAGRKAAARSRHSGGVNAVLADGPSGSSTTVSN